uniref:BRO1 domain-containing protein n=1 Tax=Romanomermis culicivorax TaxID=13658 RepID=A0A915KD28_ROMCU
MESVPRMPMLSVESKYAAVANPLEFGQKIKEYISKFYQEDGESYSNEIRELETLRENACKAPVDFTGCSLLKKYYAQLSLLRSRFPMESNDEAAVTFIWFEKYSDLSNTVAIDDIRYEMSSILHNIGALHSYLGAVDTRSTSEMFIENINLRIKDEIMEKSSHSLTFMYGKAQELFQCILLY